MSGLWVRVNGVWTSNCSSVRVKLAPDNWPSIVNNLWIRVGGVWVPACVSAGYISHLYTGLNLNVDTYDELMIDFVDFTGDSIPANYLLASMRYDTATSLYWATFYPQSSVFWPGDPQPAFYASSPSVQADATWEGHLGDASLTVDYDNDTANYRISRSMRAESPPLIVRYGDDGVPAFGMTWYDTLDGSEGELDVMSLVQGVDAAATSIRDLGGECINGDIWILPLLYSTGGAGFKFATIKTEDRGASWTCYPDPTLDTPGLPEETGFPTDISFVGGNYVLPLSITSTFECNIATSSDGEVWTINNIADSEFTTFMSGIGNLIYSGQVIVPSLDRIVLAYVALDTSFVDTTALVYSDNGGVSWTVEECNLGTLLPIWGGTFGGGLNNYISLQGKVMTIGKESVGASQHRHVVSSDDGITWTDDSGDLGTFVPSTNFTSGLIG